MSLSHQDSYHKNMIEGPQPETVKDYCVEAQVDGAWKTLAEVKGNYQRQRIHEFDTLAVKKLRLSVNSTNGEKEARVFEVRAYS